MHEDEQVANAMSVQLVYATAVKDLNAVGALENIIRLRNTWINSFWMMKRIVFILP